MSNFFTFRKYPQVAVTILKTARPPPNVIGADAPKSSKWAKIGTPEILLANAAIALDRQL